jgi:hypothetical protein
LRYFYQKVKKRIWLDRTEHPAISDLVEQGCGLSNKDRRWVWFGKKAIGG